MNKNEELPGDLSLILAADGICKAEDFFATRIHVLPDRLLEVVKKDAGTGDTKVWARACATDDSELLHALYVWILRVYSRIRCVVEEDEDFLLLTAGSLKALLYFFHNRMLAQPLCKVAYQNRRRSTDGMRRAYYGRQEPPYIQNVHVWVAICEHLTELRQVCFRDTNCNPYYGDTGCELFTGEQLRHILAACEERFHAASIPPNPQDDKEVRHD